MVFGGIVLLRYSDRPGASLKWLGVELSSTGAGLPLVALGVGCILFAVLRSPAPRASDSPPEASPKTTAEGFRSAANTPVRPIGKPAGAGDCVGAFVASVPADRVVKVEVGMRDLEVIRSDQPMETPFALILTDNAQPIGAIRLRLYKGGDSSADLYKIEAIVDVACAPVEQFRNATRGGNPRELGNWDTVRMRLGGRSYELRIGGEGNITVGRFSRAS
jgi:hypothetical protein